MPFSLWGMIDGCAFGKTLGEERRLFVSLSPLCMLWPTTRRALVAELWDSSREEGGWIPCFIRSFNDWDLDEILSLLNTSQGKQIIENMEIFR